MSLIEVQTWRMPDPRRRIYTDRGPFPVVRLNVNIEPMMKALQRVSKAIGRFSPQPAPMDGACPTCAQPRPIGDMFGIAPTCEGCQW